MNRSLLIRTYSGRREFTFPSFHAWRLWGSVLIVAMLLHGVFLFFIPYLIFHHPPPKSQPLVVELMTFPSTPSIPILPLALSSTASDPLTEKEAIPLTEEPTPVVERSPAEPSPMEVNPIEPVILITEEPTPVVERSPAEPSPMEVNPIEPVILKIKVEHRPLEEQPEELIVEKAAILIEKLEKEELPSSEPKPIEPVILDVEVERPPLEELIEEKELEQLSMEPIKSGQKAAPDQQIIQAEESSLSLTPLSSVELPSTPSGGFSILPLIEPSILDDLNSDIFPLTAPPEPSFLSKNPVFVKQSIVAEELPTTEYSPTEHLSMEEHPTEDRPNEVSDSIISKVEGPPIEVDQPLSKLNEEKTERSQEEEFSETEEKLSEPEEEIKEVRSVDADQQINELVMLGPRGDRRPTERSPTERSPTERSPTERSPKTPLIKEKREQPQKKFLKRNQFLRKQQGGNPQGNDPSKKQKASSVQESGSIPSSFSPIRNYLSLLASRSPPTGQSDTLSSEPSIPIGPSHSSSVFYGLSDYNWPYESYMGRWARGLLYNWNIYLPLDYIRGQVPDGGIVFVSVTLNLEGKVVTYGVTEVEDASNDMVTSVLNAIVGTTNLPPLPPDFKEKELEVHFKFIYPSIYRLPR